MRTVIVACVVALVAVISAQTPPDCDELDVGAPEPFTGTCYMYDGITVISLFFLCHKISPSFAR